MYVYCRRYVIGRFCVEHKGMQECETRLREAIHTTNMSMRI